MRGDRVNNWTAAEIILGIAVLALAMPAEDGLLIPERRDWLAPFRRFSRKARLKREAEGAREAEEYVTDLRRDPHDPMIIKRNELPSQHRTVKTRLLTEGVPGQKQPWATAENPAWSLGTGPQPTVRPRKRGPKDPPTVVLEVMRPAIKDDLGAYLNGLPAYTDDGEEGAPLCTAAPACCVRQIITVRQAIIRNPAPRQTTSIQTSQVPWTFQLSTRT